MPLSRRRVHAAEWLTAIMKTLLFAAFVWLGASAAAAQDWPDFRGPGGQGHSTERGLPLEWSETKNVAWKTAVPGLGWSSPVVANGKVWITTAVEQPFDSARASAAFRCARWPSMWRPAGKS